MSARVSMDDRIAAELELFARLSVEEMEEVAAESEALIAKVRMMAQRHAPLARMNVHLPEALRPIIKSGG